MSLEIAFTPSGHLVAIDSAGEPAPGPQDQPQDGRLKRIAKAFAASQGEGLFALATERPTASLAPSMAYWRDFTGRYLTALCQTPDAPTAAAAAAPREAIPPPTDAELATVLLGVPPMPGAEYVSAEALQGLWQELDSWVRGRVEASGQALSAFLKEHAPLWHQVGRVCFHLAENRQDAERPFAFLATYAPSLSNGSRVQYQPLSKALRQSADTRDKKTLVKLLSPVHLASQKSALAKELVESGDIYHPLAWTPRDAYNFLKDVPVFEECGVLVRVPDWWKKRPRPRVGVSIGGKEPKKFDAAGMLDFQVQLALGDETLSEAEWQGLLDAEDGLVLLRGQWVEVDREKLNEALDHWKKLEAEMAEGVSFAEGMRLLAGAPRDLADAGPKADDREWSFVHAGQWLGDLLAKMRDPEGLAQAEPGEDFHATLRGYQTTGVNWMWFLSSLGLGACLADDMGLGKTIQVLGLLTALKRATGKSLPERTHLAPRDAGHLAERDEYVAADAGELLAAARLKKSGAKPSLLVLPASLLGNWRSEMAHFAPSLRGIFLHPSETSKDDIKRLAENPAGQLRDTDLVLTTYGMLLRQPWLMEVPWRLAVLDEAQAIKNPAARQTKAVKQLKADARIALTGTPVENRLSDLWSLFDFLCPGLLGSQERFKKFVKSLESREKNRYAPLRSLVQPYILRRLKTDKRVIADLPDKTEVRAYCGLAKRQAALYSKLVKDLSIALEGQEEGIKRRGLVLAYLMRFKQLCNHPAQLLGDGQFAAAESGKFTRLAEICEEIASRQEKTLVFTQFREMTEPLSGLLAGIFGRSGLILHGGTPVGRRKQLVDQFQRDDGPPFFVLSLKAGGTGLNLTAASHVIHFDRWWNPAVENQATDRAFRIGQRRNVLVHKFVCRGTIEEKIDALIEEKTQLAADLLQGGEEKMLTEMSNEQLIQFVSLDIDKASE